MKQAARGGPRRNQQANQASGGLIARGVVVVAVLVGLVVMLGAIAASGSPGDSFGPRFWIWIAFLVLSCAGTSLLFVKWHRDTQRGLAKPRRGRSALGFGAGLGFFWLGGLLLRLPVGAQAVITGIMSGIVLGFALALVVRLGQLSRQASSGRRR